MVARALSLPASIFPSLQPRGEETPCLHLFPSLQPHGVEAADRHATPPGRATIVLQYASISSSTSPTRVPSVLTHVPSILHLTEYNIGSRPSISLQHGLSTRK